MGQAGQLTKIEVIQAYVPWPDRGGCTVPRDLVAPSWQVEVTEVPLFKADTVFVGQAFLAANINSNQDNILQATFSRQVSVTINSLLELDPAGSQLSGQVGALNENEPLAITGELPFYSSGVALAFDRYDLDFGVRNCGSIAGNSTKGIAVANSFSFTF